MKQIFIIAAVFAASILIYFYGFQTQELSPITTGSTPLTEISISPITPTEPDYSVFKTNQKINTDLNLPKEFTHEKADYYFNDKKELFIKTGVGGAAGLAKLVDGKWISVASWNGYPDCATFDKAGVPFKKSTIEYQCYIDGKILRASQNPDDLKEFCASIPNDSIFTKFECKNIKK